MRLLASVVALTFGLTGCAAGDEAPSTQSATTAGPTDPFVADFPKTEGVEWSTSGGQDACPSGWGSGGHDSEYDVDELRTTFAADPTAFATDPIDAVIREFEAGGAPDDRLAALRRWLRLESPDLVVLPTGPDGPADRFMLRAGLLHVDGRFFVVEWTAVCNNVWGIPASG